MAFSNCFCVSTVWHKFDCVILRKVTYFLNYTGAKRRFYLPRQLTETMEYPITKYLLPIKPNAGNPNISEMPKFCGLATRDAVILANREHNELKRLFSWSSYWKRELIYKKAPHNTEERLVNRELIVYLGHWRTMWWPSDALGLPASLLHKPGR